MAPRLSSALEAELGSALTGPVNQVTGIGWVDEFEETPELRWPQDIRVFERMGRTDAQVAGTLRAVMLPALGRVTYRLGTDGVDPRVHQFVEDEMGLRLPLEARARRKREGIVWREYLRLALAGKLKFGHRVFEQVYKVGPPGADQDAAGMPRAVAHLRKLGYRPEMSIARFDVARDGGLVGVDQYVPSESGIGMDIVPLPISRLVVHCNEREGGNWRGQSILRASYKHWLIKDALLRIGAQAVERNGMGLPVITYDEAAGATRAIAMALARRIRAGAEAAMALPTGYSLTLMGVQGQVRDELPLVKYHDQQIGKNALTMVLDLGHDNGARSLGDTFMELWALAENGIIKDFCEEVTEYVIRDLVALTFGEDEPYPPLVASELAPDQAMTPADLAALAKNGVIIPDDNLEAEIRRRANLPLWPGAADVPDFSVGDVIDVEPRPEPELGPVTPPALQQAPTPPAPAAYAGRSTEELQARLAAVNARLEARAAAGRPARRAS